MTPTEPPPRYDRRAAAEILAELAHPGLFPEPHIPSDPVPIDYRSSALHTEPNSHLTFSQRLYLERFMRPCAPHEVTSATHRLAWIDSDGVPNAGHFRIDALGAPVPIVAREAVLVLWRALAANTALARRVAALSPDQRAVLAGTTTDHDPMEIFRVGIEATARALVQHALLAHRTPYRSAEEFARGMRDSGLFAAVATRWFWELQASTYRRGMIPVSLTASPDGTVRYTAETITTLQAMKDATIAEAARVMHRATTVEGLGVDAAIARYHDDLDLISRQYALLPPGSRPACPAAATHRVDGHHYSLLPEVAGAFVEVFTTLVGRCRVTDAGPIVSQARDDVPVSIEDTEFYVPDMNCRHCVRTITGVLESLDIPVGEVDLVSKRVVAEFRSPRNRERALEAIRDGGYNPVPRLSVPRPSDTPA